MEDIRGTTTTNAPVNGPMNSPSNGNRSPIYDPMATLPLTTVPMGPSPLEEQQQRLRNLDRQKKVVADADRLVSLATDLKQQVVRTDKTVPRDVIRETEESEKLAKSVKERMKG